MIIISILSFSESKNQESPEQEANGGAKSDLTAIQNHNLLIALAHGGTSGAAQFGMPVSRVMISKHVWRSIILFRFLNQHHYQQFLRAQQFPVQGEGNGEEIGDSGDESGAENDLDSCNLPLNLVSTQLGDS